MTKFTDLGKNYINGEWVEGLSERTYQNVNPYNQTVIAAIPVATIDQVREAYQAASTAQKEWAKSTPERRKEVLEKAAQYIKDHADDIVNMIIEESGGTILKGRVEVKLALEELEEATNMVNEIYTYQEVSSHTPGKSNRVYRLPLGVITCITPFNFHMNLACEQLLRPLH
ncbi:aldehyde dehydrogenase [Halalkalibacter wakoensis JCM 9140]|uniref:Aldehyde dehydrogenase n=1 Tax=Halalkalibacter wakoensis JCM 9140 TaxID=1236970 RepID=W4Q475_9BACI|nr:aldehyde dehydrogenase [Halalkalibacter wakoensis JCM 9140]